MKEPGKTILISFAAILIFAALFEFSLAILGIDPHPQGRDFTVNRALDYPEAFLRDRDLLWRLRGGRTIRSEFFEGRSYRINRQGFRGPDFRLRKDGLRVAVLGNSCAFGWGVQDRQTFCWLLERQLRDAGLPKAEVYNFSVPGYSSFQGQRHYLKNVRSYRPDIVIVTFGWNDQWVAAYNRPDKEQKLPPGAVLAIQNHMARLRFYRLLKSLILGILPREDDETDPKLARVSLEDFRDNLKTIITTARSDGSRVVLLTSPIPALETYFDIHGRSFLHENHRLYNDAIREIAAIESVGLVDLAAIFDRYDNLFDDISRDPFHYNRLGHDLAAVEIFNFLQGSDYLIHHP